MPPPPVPNADSNVGALFFAPEIEPSPPPTNNTRALLHSLEELRDSLSIRVSQLATAVERLRDQAGQLERDLGRPGEGRRSFSGYLQPPHSERTAPPTPVNMPIEGRDSSHITTSAIATEVSNLDRPITSAEIHRLLDRASASLAATPDLFTAEMEGTLDGLREVRNSLQGGLRDLTEMGETQTRLRQRMRTRWERAPRPADEVEGRAAAPARGPRESLHQEAQRRLAEISKEAEKRRVGPSTARRMEERAARIERENRAQRPVRAQSSVLPPTISTSSTPTVVRTSGVTPPSARPSVIRKTHTRAPRPTVAAPTSPPDLHRSNARSHRNSLSRLDAASLDALHAQIAELDLNLEPTEYMSGLSRIIRRAIHPIPGAGRVDTMSLDDSGMVIHDTLPGWGPPDSPSSSTSSDHTVIDDNPDAGLTYRGRDVQDRLRAMATTPDLSELLGEDAPAVRTIQDRVAAIMGRRPDPPPRVPRITLRAGGQIIQPVPINSHEYDQYNRLRQDRIQRARDIVQDSSRSVQDAARSARELVNAATAIREDTAERSAHVADREAAYEISVQAELRAAQAQRSRAYNRYQDLVASRARREARPPPPPMSVPPPPPLGRDLGMDAVISVIPVTDNAEVDPVDLDEARQLFISAQMREAAVQQRLLWARSRLRRETPGDEAGMSERIAAMRERFLQIDQSTVDLHRVNQARVSGEEAALARSRAQGEASRVEDIWERVRRATGEREVGTPDGESRRTLGPRDERPEDVDTMVRIRQLQADRPAGPERIEARRRHVSNIRQDLAESRRRIREAGAGSTIADAGEDEGEPSIRQLLSDAQQVSDARRSLYESLDHTEWEVTPSSPITATGSGNFSHIQIATSADTRTGDRDWMGDGEEAVRRIVENVLGESGERPAAPAAGTTGDVVVESAGESQSGIDQARNVLSPKNELHTLARAPMEDEEASREHLLPAAGSRSRRRERVYISMLDL